MEQFEQFFEVASPMFRSTKHMDSEEDTDFEDVFEDFIR